MQIIRKGVTPYEYRYLTACRFCETVFIFSSHEGRSRSYQREGSWLEVECPVCRKALQSTSCPMIKLPANINIIVTEMQEEAHG